MYGWMHTNKWAWKQPKPTLNSLALLFVSRFYSVCCLPLVSSLFFKWTDHKQYKRVLIVEAKAISHTKYITVINKSALCTLPLSHYWSYFIVSPQCTGRLHRPQESGTRRSLTGEPSKPKPDCYWLRTRSHGYLGFGEAVCPPAHPCYTGNFSVAGKIQVSP